MKAELYEEIRTAEKIADYTDKAVKALKELKVYLQIRQNECPEVVKCLNAMIKFRIEKRKEYYNTLSKLDNED